MNNMLITTAEELDVLLRAVGEKATAAVLQSPGSLRPWIITEDDRGNYWAESFLVDVYQEVDETTPWSSRPELQDELATKLDEVV